MRRKPRECAVKAARSLSLLSVLDLASRHDASDQYAEELGDCISNAPDVAVSPLVTGMKRKASSQGGDGGDSKRASTDATYSRPLTLHEYDVILQQCKPGGISAHGRKKTLTLQKTGSEECGDIGIYIVTCVHGRQAGSSCKACGGGPICAHGRRKCKCRDCGGGGVCPHGRQKSICKECGGVGICVHGRRRSTCKDCGGSNVCAHGRRRNDCKECGGAGICLHG
jgi:hypothetical protein